MKERQLRKICKSLPGTTEHIRWKDHLVFKVKGKMYAILGDRKKGIFSLKAPPGEFRTITKKPGIIPTPYMTHLRWIQIRSPECKLSPARLEALVRGSYEQIVAKLPKKTREALKKPARVQK